MYSYGPVVKGSVRKYRFHSVRSVRFVRICGYWRADNRG